MWPANALTERLNLKWPILQAPMGSASTPALAAAVTKLLDFRSRYVLFCVCEASRG
jgi:hypothetical protein